MTAPKVWSGNDLSQEELMLKDECILLDLDDKVIGHANKYESHIFCKSRPRAKLHRAFSVFLFDEQGRLLLQQRAATKITFPNVWTNTCCSHPLYGYSPQEVDTPEDLASGKVPGVKHAAQRKLLHELGINPNEVPVSGFKFLTRLHYWAADVVTHGQQSPFGEHEIDYILFTRAKVQCNPNPEEVSDYKYVTLEELKLMMANTKLLWSPWFRMIVERFLEPWWEDLNATLNTDTHVDVNNIHRFDCTEEHLGGAGKAGGPWLSTPETATPDGDLWLKAVKENNGEAPTDSKEMKPLLVKQNDQWTIADEEIER
eukprot:m.276295 g.276295  ORF g.276295 m.276295 type:complete len:314 (+) comp16299_c0_seq3:237-1178(+)